MNGDSTRKYLSSGDTWARELFVMFILGVVVSTVFWLGLYVYQARPAQADALQEKTSVVKELETNLQQCSADREKLTQSNTQLDREADELDRQLRQAWTAYGRCKQGNN